MKVYIIGLGLIGGSMALDIQRLYENAEIIGIDSNENHLNEALSIELIHQKGNINDDFDGDFVILAVPVDVALVLLPKVLDSISENTLVFDVGSTKKPICEVVENHPKRSNFLATHPIAGTEFSGPKAAIENLFEDKVNIICEIEKTAYKKQEKALEFFRNLKMRIRYMETKSHDKHIAYVSHLSHISSFMLGKTVIEKEKDEKDIFDMAGSGFESTVRLAKSSPSMWTPIFKQNKKQIVKSLEEYIANLSSFKSFLESDDYEAIFNEMKNTNRIKEILK
ncbi:prephenate dehydrogenase [Flavobacterium piscinae]|uniref:Prephenate dehydrogenase n=1 Tax=Flavobacterium piscinae TaxID=2506424 RepID=A0A4Q1L113_9FLAO|nr:prephenate dehydrogenase [Flavobacterium piscinae]RXR35589.1 prephenate dehydrogenase [Flavobacterium piscinae]